MVDVEIESMGENKPIKKEKASVDAPVVVKDVKKKPFKKESPKQYAKQKERENKEADKPVGVLNAQRALKKSMGGRVRFQTNKSYKVIPSGILILDNLIGLSSSNSDSDCGGYPRGRILDIFGWEATGKSTIMTQACIEAQKLGMTPAYIDYEHTYDERYAVKQGLDLERFAYTEPSVMEDLDEVLTTYIKAGAELIVVDSVPAMTSQKVMDGESEQMASRASYLAKFLPKWGSLAAEHSTCIAFINQMRDNIGGYKEGKATGGRALPFFSTLRIELTLINKETRMMENNHSSEKEKKHTANIVKATIVKNKVGIPGQSGEFRIVLGEGIDNMHSLRTYGEKKGLVTTSGAHISYQSPNNPAISISAMGKAAFDQNFLESPALYEDLRKAVGL